MAAAAARRASKLKELQKRVEELQSEIQEKDAELSRQRALNHQGTLQKRVHVLELDNKRLADELEEAQQAQHEASRQLARQEEQQAELQRLRDELQDAKSENDAVRFEMRSMEKEHRAKVDAVYMEKDEVKARLRDASTGEVEMRQALQAREREVKDLKMTVEALREGSSIEQMDKELQHTQTLLEDAQEENEKLRAEVDELTAENNDLRLDKEQRQQGIEEQITGAIKAAAREKKALETKLRIAQDETASYKSRAEQLEANMVDNDNKLQELQDQLYNMERGYGVRQAMNQVRKLRATFKEQERENVMLKDQLNEKERNLRKLISDKLVLLERCGLPKDWGFDVRQVELESEKDLRIAQAEVASLQQLVEDLEESRSKLLNQIRRGRLAKAEDGNYVFPGLTPAKQLLVEEYVDRLRVDDKTLPMEDRSVELLAKTEALEKMVAEYKHKYHLKEVECEELRAGGGGRGDGSGAPSGMHSHDYHELLTTLGELKESMAKGGPVADGVPGVVQAVSQLSPEDQATALQQLNMVFGGPGSDGDTGSSTGQHAPFRQFKALMTPGGGGRTRARTPAGKAQGDTLAAPGFAEFIKFPPMSPFGMAGAARERAFSEFRGDEDSSGQSQKEALEHRLVGAIKELFHTEGALRSANAAVTKYREELHRACALHQALHEEHASALDKWKSERRELETDLEKTQDDLAHARAELKRVSEANVAATTLAALDPKLSNREAKLQEMLDGKANDLLVSRVNEKLLARRYNALKSELNRVRQRSDQRAVDLVNAERVLRTRIAQLEKNADTAESRALSLTEELSQSVPRQALATLAREHGLLRRRYAEMLSESATQAIERVELRDLRKEVRELRATNDELKDSLSLARKEADKLQAAMQAQADLDAAKLDKLSSGGGKRLGGAAANSPYRVSTLLAEVASLKIKFEAAQARGDRLDGFLKASRRNEDELEKRLLSVTERLEQAQRNESRMQGELVELRNSLEGTVSAERATKLRTQFGKARERIEELNAELRETKAMAETATNQAGDIIAHTQLCTTENELLREALRDLQEKSDEDSLVGKLKLEVVDARVRYQECRRTLEEKEGENERLAAELLQADQDKAQRNADFFRHTREYRTKLAQKERELVELQEMSSAAHVSMRQLELLHQTNARLSARLEEERARSQQVQKEANAAELDLAEAKTNLAANQELLDALRMDEGASAVKKQMLDWSAQVRELRLGELRLKHKVRVLENSHTFLERSNADVELMVGQLQQELAERETSAQQAEMNWKSRYAELEEKKMALDIKLRLHQKRLLKHRAKRGKDGGGGSDDDDDDDDLGVESMITELRNKVVDAERQIRSKETTISELKERLELVTDHRDTELARRDEVMQLRTAERDRILSTAQQTMESLQKQLEQKSAALRRYEEMVEKMKNRVTNRQEQMEGEIARLNQQLLRATSHNAGALHRAMKFMENTPELPKDAIPVEQVSRQLEEKEREIALLTGELEKARADLEQERSRAEVAEEERTDARSEANSLISTRAPSAKLRTMNKKLKRDLATERERCKELGAAVQALKDELLTYGEARGLSRPEPLPGTENAEASRELAALRIKHESKIAKAQERIDKLATQAKVAKAKQRKAERVAEEQKLALNALQEVVQAKEEELSAKNAEMAEAQLQWKDAKRKYLSTIALLKSSQGKKISAKAASAAAAFLGAAAQSAGVEAQLEASSELAEVEAEAEAAGAKKGMSAAAGMFTNLVANAMEEHAEVVATDAAIDDDPEAAERAKTMQATIKLLRKERKRAKAAQLKPGSKWTKARAQWEGKKKMERQLDVFRKKFKQKAARCSELEAEVAKLKRQVADTERARSDLLVQVHGLQYKVKSTRKGSVGVVGSAVGAGDDVSVAPSMAALEPVEQLREELHAAREEALEAKKAFKGRQEAEVQRLQEAEEQLKRKLERTERKLTTLQATLVERVAAGARPPYDQFLVEENDNLTEELNTIRDDMLQLKCDNVELRYEQETHTVEVEQLRRRISQLEQYKATAREEAKRRKLSGGRRGRGGQGDEQDEMVRNFRAVIEKLKRENEMLRQGTQSNVKFMEVLKENRRLKRKLKRGSGGGGDGDGDDATSTASAGESLEVRRLTDLNRQTRRSLQREINSNKKLRKRVSALEHSEAGAKAQVEKLHETVLTLQKNANAELLRATSVLKQSVEVLQTELNAKEKQLATEQELTDNLRQENRALDLQVQQLTATLQEAALPESQSRKRGRESENARDRKLYEQYQQLLAENEELRALNHDLKSELSGFDRSFFDEIEDLKYRYSENVQLLKQYERQNNKLRARVKELKGELRRMEGAAEEEQEEERLRSRRREVTRRSREM